MKKILAILVCMTLACLSFFSMASQGRVLSLKSKNGISQSITSETKEKSYSLEMSNYSKLDEDYVSSVAPILIRLGDDLFDSSLGKKDIMNAKLSKAMPVFSSKDEYAIGEDFYGKLEVNSWMFIVYSNGNPIATVSSDSKDVIGEPDSIHGQDFAKNMDDALSKINRNGAVVIPADGYYFVADENDKVALVSNQDSRSGNSGVVGFDSFNQSVNRTINYNLSQDEQKIGGSILLDELYNQEDESNNTNVFNIVMAVIVMSIVITGVVRKKKSFSI